jgi:hypothetical protein
MARQLSLLEAPRRTWQIDDATREAGRRGVAEARATLRAALARTSSSEPASAGREHPTHRRSAA